MLPRFRNLLTGLFGALGAGLMLAAAASSLGLTSGFAAVGLTEVMFGVLGTVLTTLTAIAGALIVADVRADVDAAGAWQGINAEVTVIGTQAETPPQATSIRATLSARRTKFCGGSCWHTGSRCPCLRPTTPRNPRMHVPAVRGSAVVARTPNPRLPKRSLLPSPRRMRRPAPSEL